MGPTSFCSPVPSQMSQGHMAAIRLLSEQCW